MKSKIAKRALLAGGIAVLLALFVLLALNLYVQSSGVQDKIREGFQDALGLPIDIRRTSYTPWGGLRLAGVRVAGTEGAPDLFAAEQFRATVDLSSLFGRHLLIESIRVDAPAVVLSRQPSPDPAVAAPPQPVSPPEPVEPRPAISPEDIPRLPDPTPGLPSARTAAWKTSVRAIEIARGSFVYLDDDGDTVLEIEGVHATAEIEGTDNVGGMLKIDSGNVRDQVEFAALESPFAYRDGRLRMADLRAEIAGGAVEGTFLARPEDPGPPYELVLRFRDVDLAVLAGQAGADPERYRGELSGSVVLRGDLGDPETMNGAGKMELQGGKIQQAGLLHNIGEALKIEELSSLDLEEAHLEFKVRDGLLQLAPLFLRSTNLKLEIKGWIREEGRLDLDARLFLNRKIHKKLPSLARSNLIKIDDEYSALEFEITGTASDPETNLIERFIGEKLEREVSRTLRSLFGRDRKKTDADQEKVDPPAAPEPPPAEPGADAP